jgi:hypothetical protein
VTWVQQATHLFFIAMQSLSQFALCDVGLTDGPDTVPPLRPFVPVKEWYTAQDPPATPLGCSHYAGYAQQWLPAHQEM